ncbi:family 78 glycoside hydrolase catalytic domain [Nocardioides sp. LS1]|uniref:family 78 glycoside hydrolase catalytic domain n=1 Tax=Nocardioides sp. LS1 TaxID=1027620 RepID=UPI000F61B821|nr:family 78 glycoside hydrolase catalytic domain [Nocardioides sp. LS1]GCD89970.1 alpha-L-rhamnosidase [Nocardioides sp. LS1]
MRVRVEHLDETTGIGDRRPRLSWTLPAGVSEQKAYELELDDGTSTGRVDTPDNVLVPWPGRPLRSRERRTVRVRVWTDQGDLGWSEETVLEAGLLEPGDWEAGWVRPAEDAIAEPGFRPVHLLRGELEIDKPVTRARLYASAHGVYEPWLNGHRVGDIELAPGFTEYHHRLQVQTYDVTQLVREGVNVLGAMLADGWFRGEVGVLRSFDQFGERTAFLAQLVVDHPDGSVTVLGTGPGWSSALSHVTAGDLIEGQAEDRRLVRHGWSEPGHDGAGWAPVTHADLGHDQLVASPAPPVRVVQEIRPRSVATLGPGHQVFDLGQNINGRVRLRDLGPEDTTLVLTHGEWLGPDGDVTTEHLKPTDMPFLDRELRAGMVDTVVSAGTPGDEFDPRFTTHGFQYVRVEGHPGKLTANDLTGLVVHTDLRRTGSFTCSDPRVNALHEAAVWSFRGNACDIPTDCPTRERAGWTGDWQLYVPIASFLYDVAGFSTKWLRDLAVGQWDNGVVGNMVPMPPAEAAGFFQALNGSAGWGDAAVLVPWELYQEYGDVRVLEEQWPSMVAWLGFVERTAAEQRHPDRVAARPDPAPHERHLWDAGFHWGEWLVPGEDLSDFGAFRAKDKSDVATAYFAHTAAHAARVARVLGRDDDAVRYARLAGAVADAWRREFLADGTITPENQANLVRALTFGLVPAEQRAATADRLATLVRDTGTRLGTGFLATPDLLPVLADHGHADLAYELLLQDAPPSWMAMIDRGATTVWERWEGVDADGVPHESLNHYSKGAVIGFLHRYVVGLQRLEPTWRTFRVRPMPGGGLTSASAEHESPHGRVAAAWRIEHDELVLDVTVPAGCSAEVVLPDGTSTTAGPGDHRLRATVPARAGGSGALMTSIDI